MPAMTINVDVVVLGAGFGGTLTAMVASRRGCSVLLIEKGYHPRICIGESTTPLTNLLLEEIAHDYDLPFLMDFTQWGRWKRKHPSLRVGLKRGFSFFNHQKLAEADSKMAWNRELIVAASPNDNVADTHWWRSDWDSYLVKQSMKLGVGYMDNTVISNLAEHQDGIELELIRAGIKSQVKAKILIDASGGKTGMAEKLSLSQEKLRHTPETLGVYGHFEHVKPWMDTQVTKRQRKLPYPPENAAVHHIVEGGWIWCLRFDHGTVSAGASLVTSKHEDIQHESPEIIWQHLLRKHPRLAHMFAQAKTIYPLRKIPRIGYRMERMHGDRWIMLPSVAGFVDPLLSTGFPLTLHGIKRLGRLISPYQLAKNGPIHALSNLAKITFDELALSDEMIGTLFATMNDFRHFATASLLYFSNVSFSETSRRLGKAYLSPGFLCSGLPGQSLHLKNTLATIRDLHAGNLPRDAKWHAIQQVVKDAVDPINIVGLDPLSSSPWFYANPEPLLKNAHKVRASQEEIQGMLARCGLSNGATDASAPMP
ncbi:MAG: tryptophan 7-halogenase [Verrucomicrobiota bacterium]|jgi:tetracycline 7-halogenase / FADH2 O2-dependent halogenase|nr:tryptophan 7-halogenase [Verrucomicrobiota bacterium]